MTHIAIALVPISCKFPWTVHIDPRPWVIKEMVLRQSPLTLKVKSISRFFVYSWLFPWNEFREFFCEINFTNFFSYFLFMNYEGAPNYFPNSFGGPRSDRQYLEHAKNASPSADVGRFNSADEDNFTQCGIFFRDVLNSDEKFRLVDNIASHIIGAQEFLQVCKLQCCKWKKKVLWEVLHHCC